MTKRVIKNEQDFESLMREIDTILHQKGVPIRAREIWAVGEAADILGVELIAVPLRTGPIPGVYEGESLSAHIRKWVRNRYGDRLKVDFSDGYSVILLRGDPWLCNFPVIFAGEVKVVCERNLAKKFPNLVTLKPGEPPRKPILNLLLCIEDLLQGLANDLSDSELRAILKFFLFGHEFLNALNSFCRKDQLAMSGLSDLNAAARYCVAGTAEYGLSRWSSLQAAEKLLKYYIEKRGATFPYKHDLSILSQRAYQVGLPQIEGAVLHCVQCDAGVRYEQRPHTPQEVVNAHHGAMKIGSIVIKTLFPI